LQDHHNFSGAIAEIVANTNANHMTYIHACNSHWSAGAQTMSIFEVRCQRQRVT